MVGMTPEISGVANVVGICGGMSEAPRSTGSDRFRPLTWQSRTLARFRVMAHFAFYMKADNLSTELYELPQAYACQRLCLSNPSPGSTSGL